jgi:hypothetical protein
MATDIGQILYSVDSSEPITAKEFIKVNVLDDDVDSLTAEELIKVLSLKVGETWEPGMGADIKRIQ